MSAVFLKVLNMSLTASLLIITVVPIRLLLKKAPKWTSCLLWLIVAVALVAPVRLESRASVLPVSDPIPAADVSDAFPIVQDTPTLISDLTEEQSNTARALSLTEIGTIIWGIGMAALLCYALYATFQLKRRVAASIEAESNVFLCDDIDSPFILGIFRPRIYLPSALEEHTAAQVLRHERAHLARKDHWWKPLGYLLLTIHWFNPLVWVAYSLLCTDIELACDEKVIKNMDTDNKKAYSEALLTCSMPRRMITACPLAFGEVSVKHRIRAVLHYKKPAFWIIMIALVICIVLCFGFLTEPKIITPENLSSTTVADIESISVDGNLYNDFDTMSAICALLSNLKLQERAIRPNVTQGFQTIHILLKNDTGYCMVSISPDHTELVLNYAISEGDARVVERSYKILNPELLQNINFSDLIVRVPNPPPHSGTPHTTEAVKAAIEASLNTGSFDVTGVFSDAFFQFDTFYCTAVLTCVAKNGVISHNKPIALTIKYKDSLFVIDELENEAEIESILLTTDPVSVSIFQSNETATLKFRGNVILNPQTGEILSITSYPVEQGSDLVLPFSVYSDMNESFRGYEALYDAIKTDPDLNPEKRSELTLIGTKSHNGSRYAVIGHTQKTHGQCVLLEYQTNPDGSVSILSFTEGTSGDTLGNFGYAMNYALLSGKSLYWTTFGNVRWATTKDGKETDTTKTVPTDYTGFRFIWADLHQIDYPADDGFFLAEVNSVIPPAISIPMVGNNALSALGRNLS